MAASATPFPLQAAVAALARTWHENQPLWGESVRVWVQPEQLNHFAVPYFSPFALSYGAKRSWTFAWMKKTFPFGFLERLDQVLDVDRPGRR